MDHTIQIPIEDGSPDGPVPRTGNRRDSMRSRFVNHVQERLERLRFADVSVALASFPM